MKNLQNMGDWPMPHGDWPMPHVLQNMGDWPMPHVLEKSPDIVWDDEFGEFFSTFTIY